MLPTYKAILKGNRVEWCGDVDRNIVGNHPVAVHITILDDPVAPASVESRGNRMVNALERLAEIHGLADVVDPAAWEREYEKTGFCPAGKNDVD